jgi:hypothetical protein
MIYFGKHSQIMSLKEKDKLHSVADEIIYPLGCGTVLIGIYFNKS